MQASEPGDVHWAYIAILRYQYFVFLQPGCQLRRGRLKHTETWKTYASFWMKLPVEGEVRRPAPDRIASSMDGRRLSFLLLWMHPVVE